MSGLYRPAPVRQGHPGAAGLLPPPPRTSSSSSGTTPTPTPTTTSPDKTGAELRGIVDLGGQHALAVSVEGVYEDIDSQGLRGGVWGEALGDHVRAGACPARPRNGPTTAAACAGSWAAGVDARNDYAPRFAGTGAVSYDLIAVPCRRAAARAPCTGCPPSPTSTTRTRPTWATPTWSPKKAGPGTLGLDFDSGPWCGQAAYFERYETNRIDWARPEGDTVWQVLNIADGTVRGVETGAGWRHSRGHSLDPGLDLAGERQRIRAGITRASTPCWSRAIADGPGHGGLPRNLSWTVTGRYLEHTGGPDDFRTLLRPGQPPGLDTAPAGSPP